MIRHAASAALLLAVSVTAVAANPRPVDSSTPAIDKHAVVYQAAIRVAPAARPSRQSRPQARYSHRRATSARPAAQTPIGDDLPVTASAPNEPAPAQWGRSAQIMPHPQGCPRRLFCGCGTSLYLLGKAVQRGGLAIAANWLGFPPAAPAPNMAAARRGHVFAIVSVLGTDRRGHRLVLAYDPNSGRGLTRLHVRSLRGYKVVNPHGARHASAS